MSSRDTLLEVALPLKASADSQLGLPEYTKAYFEQSAVAACCNVASD
jgi:hypothetical protein